MIEVVSISELKEYFQLHYGFIDLEMTDSELREYLNQGYIIRLGSNLPMIADLLADHLLAQGANAIE